MRTPYISITDFRTKAQSELMLETLRKTGSGRRLGIGVMMSWKTLYGHQTKWSDAFPKNEEIADIFLPEKDAYNVLHYADYDGHGPLAEHLEEVLSWCGKSVNAFQLDMVWPDPNEVQKFKARHPEIGFIIQMNENALDFVGNDPKKMIEKLYSYGKSIEYVLLDKSMGKGVGMDAVALLPFALAIEEERDSLDIALAGAGGLGPDTMYLIGPLAYELPGISCDAQSKLRPSGNALDPIDWEMAKNYLVRAAKFFLDNWMDRR